GVIGCKANAGQHHGPLSRSQRRQDELREAEGSVEAWQVERWTILGRSTSLQVWPIHLLLTRMELRGKHPMGLLDFQFIQKPNPREGSWQEKAAATFRVANVWVAKGLLPEAPYKSAVDALLSQPTGQWGQQNVPKPPKYPVEACSCYHGRLVAGV